jgi:hypothetical protein
MTKTEMALETLVYSPLNHPTHMLDLEYFIYFTLCEIFKLFI